MDAIETSLENFTPKQPSTSHHGRGTRRIECFSNQTSSHGILVIGNESQGIATSTDALLTHRIAMYRRTASWRGVFERSGSNGDIGGGAEESNLIRSRMVGEIKNN
ncbi:MAG: hypothetical protein IPJ74_25770 [Saprospiraceae bacterium]|nr:hypothetical protein [Saprospiraceae bacterium]